MGAVSINIPKELAVTWPILVKRTGCSIQLALATAGLDAMVGSHKTDLLFSDDLDALTSGVPDVWVDVAWNNTHVRLAVLDKLLLIFRSRLENTPLGRSLIYMFLSSGAILYAEPPHLTKGILIFRGPLGSVSAFVQKIQARQIAMTTDWTTVTSDRLNDDPEIPAAEPFRQMQLSRSEFRIEAWTGPAMNPTDATVESFVAIRFQKSWRGRSEQNAFLNEVLQLLAETRAQKVEGYIRACSA